MERRSTNVKGFVHFGGDVRSGVEHGIGFSVGSASTGSTAWIETISDDTNAHLGIRAQGAGTITIGTSSNTVTMPGGLVAGAGTGTFKGAYSTTFAWTHAAISSGQSGAITLTTSVGDVNPAEGDLVTISLGDISAYVGLAVQALRFSTVATSRVTIVVGNISSTATSTMSGTGRINWIDLT